MNKSRQEKQLSFQNQRRKNYFEGWYFKQVSTDESVVLALIPSMMRRNGHEHAMLQIILAEKIEGKWKIQTHRLDFPMSAFDYASQPFALSVSNNTFTKKGISLKINTPSLNIEGKISFGPFTTLPTTNISPTIMGPFSYLPFMECIHGIGSLHHSLKGSLRINERSVSFDQGIGYIEKDWGQSFPEYYVWLQSNHFRQRPSCLFFSWADIPLGPYRFPGFICHLWIDGKHHRFATYNGASCTIEEMREDRVTIMLRKRNQSLRIQARVDTKGTLSAPKHGQMDHQIKEGLAGSIAFRFADRKTSEVITDYTSLAGVEIVPKLIKNK